jgi:putative heme transporter
MFAVGSLAASRKPSLPRRDLTRDTSAIPGPRERGYQREVADRAPDETADELCTSRPEPGPAIKGRPRRGRKIIRTAVSAILIAATFGFAIPRIASYRSVWASIHMMTWPHILLVAAAAAASMASYWITIRAVLPRLNLRQAATVNLGSNAVANTLPAGGALAMGVSWAMLSSWGLSTADFVLYTLVTGIWNVFTLLGMPVLALLVMTTATRPDAVLITAAAIGLAVLAAMVIGLGLLLHSQAFALRAGRALQRLLAVASRLARRPPPANAAGSLSSFRDRAGALLAARGWRITAATVASYLALWLVLLACLRGTGLSQAQMPWQTSLAAFAFIRLLTALPITPGGLGVTELGLVGILATSAGSAASVQVTAAVLLYRAVTYLPPIPLGALACLTWRLAPALTGTSPYRASPVSAQPHDRTGPFQRTSSPRETASQPSAPARTG